MKKSLIQSIFIIPTMITLLVIILIVYNKRTPPPSSQAEYLRLWLFSDPSLGETTDKLNKIFDHLVVNTTYVQPQDQMSDSPHNLIQDSHHIIEIKTGNIYDEIWIDGKNSSLRFEHIFRHRCCDQFAPFPTLTADGRFIFVNYTLHSAELVELNLDLVK